jgi:hypothetical protein
MAKNLLTEAQRSRFAKLANINPINEMYQAHGRDDEEKMEEGAYGMHKRDHDDEEKMEEGAYGMHKRHDDEEKMEEVVTEEDAAEEMAADAAEAGMDELPGADEEEMEMDAGDTDLELSQDMVDAIAAALPALQMIADASDEGEEGGEEAGEEEMEMDAGEDMEDEEMMEALEGVTYIPEQQEVVNEVAKRVAKRLLKAKRAQASLQEALGNKRSSKAK